jgi:hypothetical protein
VHPVAQYNTPSVNRFDVFVGDSGCLIHSKPKRQRRIPGITALREELAKILHHDPEIEMRSNELGTLVQNPHVHDIHHLRCCEGIGR